MTSSSQNLERFYNQINELNVDLIIFHFYPDQRSVKLGATIHIQQEIVMFEKCKKLVHSKRKKV